MRVLHARNVHQALPKALDLLRTSGVRVDTRNGFAWQVPGGVTTVYERPMERVIFHPARDCNPFFHFYESMWMLAGRDDVASLARYVPRMAEFSDDGARFNAAYGYRWRHSDVGDQLGRIMQELRLNPSTRQCVLQIWDAAWDLGTNTKDHACNIAATFQENPADRGSLDMVVFCRSNDIVWGAYGANAVHMSYLLEYVARCASLTVGTYTQVSVNWHGYQSTAKPLMESLAAHQGWCADPYEESALRISQRHADDTQRYFLAEPHAMRISDQVMFDDDLRHLTSNGGKAPEPHLYAHQFFGAVALPIIRAHDAWKNNRDPKSAMAHLAECEATDWRLACEQWIQRRIK